MLGFHFLSSIGFPLEFTFVKMIHAYFRECFDFFLGNCEKKKSGYIFMAGPKCKIIVAIDYFLTFLGLF